MKNKLSYLYLLLNLKIVFFLTFLLRKTHPLLSRKKKGDIILFPYSQKGSDGYKRRFEEYFDFLHKENIKFKVCDILNDEEILKSYEGNPSLRYKLFLKILWTRFYQVLEARHYKAAFIHRGLFPYYPDLSEPHFEKLLRKLNNNITIDFWDSVWLYSGDQLIKKTVLYCDKISAVNEFIADYFKFSNKPKILFPIGVNLTDYKTKTEFKITRPVKLFYTGGPGNVKNFINLIGPILNEIKNKFNIKLIIVSRARIYHDDINIEYHDFNETTFYEIIQNCDIGLYKVKPDNESKGKMAMKVLDCMSAGLPVICSPYGLSPYAINEKHCLYAKDKQEWILNLERLIKNEDLRKKMSSNALSMMSEKHSIKKSFKEFKDLIHI